MTRTKGYHGIKYQRPYGERAERGRIDIPLENLAYHQKRVYVFERTRTLIEIASIFLETTISATVDLAMAALIDKLNENLREQGLPIIDREAWSMGNANHFKEKRNATERLQTGSGGQPDGMAKPGGHGRPGRRGAGKAANRPQPHVEGGGGHPGPLEPGRDPETPAVPGEGRPGEAG